MSKSTKAKVIVGCVLILAVISMIFVHAVKEKSAEEKIANRLALIQENAYPDGSYFELSGFHLSYECFGFAKKIQYLLFYNNASWNYDGEANYGLKIVAYIKKPYNSTKIKSLMSKAKAGDIIQMASGDTTSQHSMIFCSSNASGFTVYDANWQPCNEVDIRTEKYDAYNDLDCEVITILRNEDYNK